MPKLGQSLIVARTVILYARIVIDFYAMAFINTHRIVINVARIAIPDSKAFRMLPVSKLLRLGQHQIAAKFFLRPGHRLRKKPQNLTKFFFFWSKIVFAHI